MCKDTDPDFKPAIQVVFQAAFSDFHLLIRKSCTFEFAAAIASMPLDYSD